MRLRASSMSRYGASGAVFVVGVGEGLSLRGGEALELEVAGGLSDGKTVAGRGVEGGGTGECAILFGGFRVVSGMVVGVAKRAEFGDSEGGFGAHGGELCAGGLGFSAKGVPEEEALEEDLGLLGLAEGVGDLRLGQLIAGAAGGAWGGGENALGFRCVIQGELDIGFELGDFGVEDAVGIAGGEAVKLGLGCGFGAGQVIGFGCEEIVVVGKLLTGEVGEAELSAASA